MNSPIMRVATLGAARPAPSPVKMCSGYGQFHTNEPDPDEPHKKLTPYAQITLEQIREMVRNPPSVEKEKAQWVRYSLDSVKFVFATGAEEAGIEATNDTAAKILEFIRQKGRASRTEIANDCLGKHATKTEINAVLEALLNQTPPAIIVEKGVTTPLHSPMMTGPMQPAEATCDAPISASVASAFFIAIFLK